MGDYDVIIIGGGLFGLSVAFHLSTTSTLSICVLEKEDHLGIHQSGRNSGTLHPGLLMELDPGTLQTDFSLKGIGKMKDYCRTYDIPINDCGLLAVATTPEEIDQLDVIEKRAHANGIHYERWDSSESIQKHEPHVGGEEAIYSRDSAVIYSKYIVDNLVKQVVNAGVDIRVSHTVTGISASESNTNIQTNKGQITSSFLVNAAGSWAVDLAHHLNIGTNLSTIPLRARYYELVFDRRNMIQTNVYPVSTPDIEGYVDIHFTRRPDGKVIVGPTGSLSSSFDNYDGFPDIRGLASTAISANFWRYMNSPKRWRLALSELQKTHSKTAFVKGCRKLVPSIESVDLKPSFVGIGHHVIDEHGDEAEGFILEYGPRSLHFLRVHPGATASLAAGEYAANTVLEQL